MLDEDGSCDDTGLGNVIADALFLCTKSLLTLGEGGLLTKIPSFFVAFWWWAKVWKTFNSPDRGLKGET